MTEERLIYFDMDDLMRIALPAVAVAGLEAPGRDYLESHRVMAAVSVTGDEEDRSRRFLFVATVPEGPDDDLNAMLWSNGLLNAATVSLRDDFMAEAAELGLSLSEMRGPGIGNVPMELAKDIVELTGADRIGVTVNGSGTMCPAFTRCGFFTAGSAAECSAEGDFPGCGECLGCGQGCSLCIRGQKMI